MLSTTCYACHLNYTLEQSLIIMSLGLHLQWKIFHLFGHFSGKTTLWTLWRISSSLWVTNWCTPLSFTNMCTSFTINTLNRWASAHSMHIPQRSSSLITLPSFCQWFSLVKVLANSLGQQSGASASLVLPSVTQGTTSRGTRSSCLPSGQTQSTTTTTTRATLTATTGAVSISRTIYWETTGTIYRDLTVRKRKVIDYQHIAYYAG